jgi:hypothetical protein
VVVQLVTIREGIANKLRTVEKTGEGPRKVSRVYEVVTAWTRSNTRSTAQELPAALNSITVSNFYWIRVVEQSQKQENIKQIPRLRSLVVAVLRAYVYSSTQVVYMNIRNVLYCIDRELFVFCPPINLDH